MNYSKGQASFELILLVAFVITLSILIGSYFFQDSENSKLLANSKSVFLRELNNENGFYSIQQFDLVSSSSPANKTLQICLIPAIPASEESIKNAIKAEVPGIDDVVILSVSTSKNIC
ncbi:MAG: hypothetical protein Q7R70_00485 [Candidatus Diapherotrites archaeon]|nr:hypothetical protein [Candidatus Diapherotrites archaeon]